MDLRHQLFPTAMTIIQRVSRATHREHTDGRHHQSQWHRPYQPLASGLLLVAC